MNRYIALALNDLRGISRDPMLAVGILGPLALLTFIRYGFPIIDIFVEESFSLNLSHYSRFMTSLFMLITPMLVGMMAGFLMLDERDEQMVSYYAVTPLTRRGYLIQRLGLPTVLSIGLNVMFLSLSGLEPFNWLGQLAVIMMLALETPMFALFLVSFASNKVEGLALSKVGGIFLAGPIFVYFIPGAWSWTGSILPMFWTARLYEMGMQLSDYSRLLYAVNVIIALGIHVLLFLLMLRRYEQQSD